MTNEVKKSFPGVLFKNLNNTENRKNYFEHSSKNHKEILNIKNQKDIIYM